MNLVLDPLAPQGIRVADPPQVTAVGGGYDVGGSGTGGADKFQDLDSDKLEPTDSARKQIHLGGESTLVDLIAPGASFYATKSDTAASGLLAQVFNSGATAPTFFGIRGRGTHDSPAGAQDGDIALQFAATAYTSDGTNGLFFGQIAGLSVRVQGNPTATTVPLTVEITNQEGTVIKTHQGRNVVIGSGSTVPTEKLNVQGRLELLHTTSPSSTTSYGKLWVNTADSYLYFTDDAGNHHNLIDIDINDLLPAQTGNANKFLITDGSTASWQSISQVEPRDFQGVLRGLEDRSKYALVGSGPDADYDVNGFTVDNPGDIADGGFDIYNEYVPLWQGYNNSDMNNRPYQEVFTIEDDAASGGDLMETAIVWEGRKCVPFAELTAADSLAERGVYGEYPSVIYSNDQYNGEMFMLQRVRYTYDPDTGELTMYRPRKRTESADDTAFGVEWKIAQVTPHQNPGSHPIASIDPTKPLKIGKGSGRYLISRVTVNAFDGTPYCDFDPVANTVDEGTVYDPVLNDNWVNTSSSYAKIVNSVDIANGLTGQVTGSGTNGFEYTGDYENTGTYVYIGYEHSDGRWYIYRRTISSGARLYASGTSSYATNWTNRGSLTYS
jgi:hypothetical protein